MREENRFRKQTPKNSLDGFIPQRPRHITTPEYYRKATEIGRTPRRSVASRRRPIDPEAIQHDKPEEPIPRIANFDQKETDIFDTKAPITPLDEKPLSRRARKQEKKEKKHGKLRTWWRNRSRRFKVSIILLVLVLLGGGLLGYRLYGFLNSVFGRGIGNSSSAALNGEVRPEDLNTEGDGRLNVLLLGRGGSENEAPDLTDTLLIASIDLKNQTASLLSIPRDTYVDNQSDNSKINGVFSRAKEQALYRGQNNDQAEDAGIKATISAVRNIAGVPIHKYVLTDYKAFRDVVNALGGVDVTVPEAIYDGFTGWSFKAGAQTMNGDKALQYARTRHGSDRGDFDRTENQRRLLIAMRQKATSTGIVANPIRLNSLANAVQKNIRTDLSIDESRSVFDKLKTMPETSIKSLDLDDPKAPLVTTGMANGQSIVRPLAGLEDYTKIRAYARTNMMDPYLKQESPTIAVYNGSSKAGTATLVGDILAGYGYKVLEKETSKEVQPKTLIIKVNKDAKKPFTERFLTVRFGTVITSELPATIIPAESKITTTKPAQGATSTKPMPDYIIVLGADYRQENGPTW
jgi:LCP family protein required for cell wall assembly